MSSGSLAGELFRLRVIRRMQIDCVRIMVDGDIDVTSGSLFDTGRCATTTGKQINNQFTSERQNELRCQHTNLKMFNRIA